MSRLVGLLFMLSCSTILRGGGTDVFAGRPKVLVRASERVEILSRKGTVLLSRRIQEVNDDVIVPSNDLKRAHPRLPKTWASPTGKLFVSRNIRSGFELTWSRRAMVYFEEIELNVGPASEAGVPLNSDEDDPGLEQVVNESKFEIFDANGKRLHAGGAELRNLRISPLGNTVFYIKDNSGFLKAANSKPIKVDEMPSGVFFDVSGRHALLLSVDRRTYSIFDTVRKDYARRGSKLRDGFVVQGYSSVLADSLDQLIQLDPVNLQPRGSSQLN